MYFLLDMAYIGHNNKAFPSISRTPNTLQMYAQKNELTSFLG